MATSRTTKPLGTRKRSASEVKTRWRDIVAEAKAYGEVLVTNYNRPEVVVLSVDRYTKLKDDATANDPLAILRAQFDRELAVLGEARGSSKLRRVFASTPAQLAKAANVAASRRRR